MAGELLELVVGRDQALRARVTHRVQVVIADSFRQDKSKITTFEIHRRFRMLETLIRELRSEHGWAFTRILDVLPRALRCRLDRIDWDPTKERMVWPG